MHCTGPVRPADVPELDLASLGHGGELPIHVGVELDVPHGLGVGGEGVLPFLRPQVEQLHRTVLQGAGGGRGCRRLGAGRAGAGRAEAGRSGAGRAGAGRAEGGRSGAGRAGAGREEGGRSGAGRARAGRAGAGRAGAV